MSVEKEKEGGSPKKGSSSKGRYLSRVLICFLVAVLVLASMGFCYYQQWKVEQDMRSVVDNAQTQTVKINLENPDLRFILNPIVPPLDTMCGYQTIAMNVRGKKVQLPIPPNVVYGGLSNYFYPDQIDTSLAEEKGLMNAKGRLNQTYMKLEAVYRAAFNAYLDNAGTLAEVDQTIVGSSVEYPLIPSKQMFVHQQYGSFGRKYVYLENDFYIEKLSESDLDLLKHPAQENLSVIMEMVERTYKDVISAPKPSNGGSYEQSYGVNDSFNVANGTVVLAIGYEAYEEGAAGWTTKTRDANEDWINQQADSLQKTLAQQLGCPIAVFTNDESGEVQ
jgi:hypothetical protein